MLGGHSGVALEAALADRAALEVALQSERSKADALRKRYLDDLSALEERLDAEGRARAALAEGAQLAERELDAIKARAQQHREAAANASELNRVLEQQAREAQRKAEDSTTEVTDLRGKLRECQHELSLLQRQRQADVAARQEQQALKQAHEEQLAEARHAVTRQSRLVDELKRSEAELASAAQNYRTQLQQALGEKAELESKTRSLSAAVEESHARVEEMERLAQDKSRDFQGALDASAGRERQGEVLRMELTAAVEHTRGRLEAESKARAALEEALRYRDARPAELSHATGRLSYDWQPSPLSPRPASLLNPADTTRPLGAGVQSSPAHAPSAAPTPSGMLPTSQVPSQVPAQVPSQDEAPQGLGGSHGSLAVSDRLLGHGSLLEAPCTHMVSSLTGLDGSHGEGDAEAAKPTGGGIGASSPPDPKLDASAALVLGEPGLGGLSGAGTISEVLHAEINAPPKESAFASQLQAVRESYPVVAPSALPTDAAPSLQPATGPAGSHSETDPPPHAPDAEDVADADPHSSSATASRQHMRLDSPLEARKKELSLELRKLKARIQPLANDMGGVYLPMAPRPLPQEAPHVVNDLGVTSPAVHAPRYGGPGCETPATLGGVHAGMPPAARVPLPRPSAASVNAPLARNLDYTSAAVKASSGSTPQSGGVPGSRPAGGSNGGSLNGKSIGLAQPTGGPFGRRPRGAAADGSKQAALSSLEESQRLLEEKLGALRKKLGE